MSPQPPALALENPGELRTRPWGRLAMHWVRRLHLYLGLFLFPWAVLFGVTGFLFNHPSLMNPQPIRSFDRLAWATTAMEQPVQLHESVRQVVDELNRRGGEVRWIASEPVRYAGEFAFAKLDTEQGEVNLLLDVFGEGGTIRVAPPKPKDPPGKAPFEIVPPAATTTNPEFPARVQIAGSLADRLQSSGLQLLKAINLPDKPLVLTSVPDLLFVVESGGQRWRAAYNSLKGTVTSKPLEVEPLPWRNFLLRLHTTHVYPFASGSTKWLWVLGADVTALVLIYWGVSGLLMWWQIKSTRRWGLAILCVSGLAATWLAIGMHAAIHM